MSPERRSSVLGILFLALTVAASSATASEHPKGTLVVVGGGATTPEIVSRTIALAGGPRAIVVVLPQSSAEPDAGESSVTMWREAGAQAARTVSFDDRAAAAAALNEATLIWMPGGDQNRFMKTIQGTGIDDIIRARYRAGAVVGGTSAGAAVLSAVMITGDADLQAVTSHRTVTAAGLGLWREAIVDQHFLKRQRQNRLISAVIDHPDLLGVGIDEGTAVIVRGTRMEVVGRSAAVVVDARRARVAPSTGGVGAATGMTLHVLRGGMSLDLR